MNILKSPVSRVLFVLGQFCFYAACAGKLIPPGTTPVHPINPSSPYASVLQSCGYAATTDEVCTLETLPYLGQSTMKPTVQDILDRTLVSNDFLGQHFREFLTIMPDNLLLLFRSTTCVVITKDVYYFSYYDPNTSCVVLGSTAFWLTPSEQQSLDLKSSSASKGFFELQFYIAFRAVLNNTEVFPDESSAATKARTIDDIKYRAAWGLYHELGHAADAVPLSLLSEVSSDQKPIHILGSRLGNSASDQLSQKFPLSSTILKSLTPVLWQGKEPTDDQRAFTVAQAASEFSADSAVQDYNYINAEEDLAESFAHFMMFYNFGVEFDVAVTPLASGVDSIVIDDQVVLWGQRRRIASPQLRDKIIFVVQSLIPDWAATVDFNKLGSSKDLPSGKSWRETLVQ